MRMNLLWPRQKAEYEVDSVLNSDYG